VIGSGPRAGESIPVETDTHVTGVLEHEGGALSTVLFSFDAPATSASPLEVHGDGGSLVVPDPNLFAGDVRVRRAGDAGGDILAPAAGYVDAARGIGLLDLVWRGADAARASGAVALHVTEIMMRLLDSAAEGRRLPLQTRAAVPELVPLTPPELWRGAHLPHSPHP
jgi:predicted dehydrogenase